MGSPPPRTLCWGLARRRELPVPTWRGWVVILTALGLGMALIGLIIHPFLAVSNGVPGGVLVVEGWGNDRALEWAVAEFQTNSYERVIVTGGPVEWGAPLAEYKTYAARGGAILLKLGLSPQSVTAVPSPAVEQDRTYTAALSLREWFQRQGETPDRVHLVTEGAHARRSRLLFRKALGPSFSVTVTAVPAHGYDPGRWWSSSSGVRIVISETAAYLYVRLLFHPKNP